MDVSNVSRGILIWVLALFLASCRLGTPAPPGAPQAAGADREAALVATGRLAVPALAGRVVFPVAVPGTLPERKALATMADVATASTVSLIDTGMNRTVAATVTDSDGQFALAFPGGFVPDANATYYLEAVKGLSSNRPGSSAARVRTLARFGGGSWQTITAGAIVISRSTTALSIGAALRHGNPNPFDFTTLLGAVAPGEPDLYSPVAGLSQTDYGALVAIVSAALLDNSDPVFQTGLALPNSWARVNKNAVPTFADISPKTGIVGTPVTVSGSGFSATLPSNSVRFNGAPATPTAGGESTLQVAVPAGATSGQTSVQIGNIAVLGPLFTVPVVFSGLNPGSGSPGSSVTISGSGFDTAVLANNKVKFSGVAATATSADAGGLTVTVPVGAVTGPVSVTVAGQSASSSGDFTVPVVVDTFSPSAGPGTSPVTITGSGFSGNLADNVVKFNGVTAIVTEASPTSLTATAPSGGSTGLVTVTVKGQSGTSAAAFTYAPPSLAALHEPVQPAGRKITVEGNFGSTATVNFPGGQSAAATVLGANRLEVAVPAGVTAGDLTVTSGGGTTGALPFRSPTFGLGLGQFGATFGEAASPRRMPALATPRELFATMVLGNWLYVAGGVGGNATVERAQIQADGTLGDFATTPGTWLAQARYGHAATVIGNQVYIIGGKVPGTYFGSIERAAFNADGIIGGFGGFSTAPGVSLATARAGHTAFVCGGFLYVAGGNVADGTPTRLVERASIHPDGSLGSFAIAKGVTLATARNGAASQVIGRYAYVFGGYGSSTALDSVERAPIGPDGSLGAFSQVGGVSLARARFFFGTQVLGDNLYVIGGHGDSAQLGTIEKAPINADGSLGTFATVAGASLGTPRGALGSAVIGNHLYVVGGRNNSTNLGSVERAPINATGNLSAFSGSASLTRPRVIPSTAVIGNYLYVIGGDDGNGYTATVERAPVSADGTLGPFALVSGVNLVTPRCCHASAVAGNYLYVIGGFDRSFTNLASVERAAINADGTIGTFSTVPGVSLLTARRHVFSAVVGNFLFAMAGYSTGPSGLVERAPIDPDGTIGAFTSMPGLNVGRYAAASVTSGNNIYVLGSYAGITAVERAQVAADGSIAGWSVVSNLTGDRQAPAVAVIGNYLYVNGGYNGDPNLFATTERAAINADGSLGAFSIVPGVTPVTPRVYAASALLGDYFYVLGGHGPQWTRPTTSERTILK